MVHVMHFGAGILVLVFLDQFTTQLMLVKNKKLPDTPDIRLKPLNL